MNKRSIPADGIPIASLERGGWTSIDLSVVDNGEPSNAVDTSWRNLIVHVALLSDNTRLAMILLLEQRERSVKELMLELDSLFSAPKQFSQPAVSHHKKLLLTAGFIDERKDGKQIFSHITHCCAGFLQEFRTLLIEGSLIPKPALSFEHDTVTPENVAIAALTASLLVGDRRMPILKCLEGGRMSVSELCTAFGMTQPAMSHHLSILLAHGLVQQEVEGRFHFYSLTEIGSTVAKTVNAWLATHSHVTDISS